MKPRLPSPDTCPVCGADVPRNARACPQCGADENSGWNEEETSGDGLDLPDEEFDYDRFAEKEFGHKRPKPFREQAGWILAVVVAIVLILSLVLGWF